MALHLDLDRTRPRRPQLERQLREAIRDARLRPGTRLPATRALATELGVSRGVVVEAYEQLVAEGWLVAKTGAGTRVAPRAPIESPAPPVTKSLETAPRIEIDLRTGRPDLSAFPRAAWLAALGRALRTLPDEALGYGDPRGLAALREALAATLGRTRGVVTDAEHIVVTGGLYQGLPILLRVLRERGVRKVAIEDPGWRGQRRAVEQAGLEPVLVRVDDRGLVVDELPDDAGAVAVTPAHQYPLGMVLAPERRAALLDWARRRDAVVIEDDYDAEYRYDREPVGALQGLDPDRVVFAGSTSKTLAPGLRLGWLALPPWLAHEVAREKDLTDRGTAVLEQAALADLLDRGDVDRHLRRNRRRYRARRDALVAALEEHAPGWRIGGAAAGLHLVAWLPEGTDARAVAAKARERGIAVQTLHDDVTCVAPRPPALLLGYAAVAEPALERAARELAVSGARACGVARTPPTSGCSRPGRA